MSGFSALLMGVLLFCGAPRSAALAAPVPYYVATDGNDANPGTEARPWKSLAKAASMATANVTVFIMQGTYNERLIPKHSGTANEPVTFTAYPGHSVTITGQGIAFPSGRSNDRWWNAMVQIEGLQYLSISGLQVVDSGASAILVRNSSHVTVEKNVTRDSYSPGICVNTCDHIIVRENEVIRGCAGGDQECISFSITDFFEIRNNRVHDGMTEGIDVKDGSSNGIVQGNDVYNQRADRGPPGIYIDSWDLHEFNIDVVDNSSHDNASGFAVAAENGGLLEAITLRHNRSYGNGNGFVVAGWGIAATHPMKNIEFDGNAAYRNHNGFEIGGFSGMAVEGLKICNNLIYGNEDTGVRITRYDGPGGAYHLRDIEIINNTIYGNGTSAGAWEDGGVNIFKVDPEKLLLRNNIISRNAAYTLCIRPDVPSATIVIDHNLFDGFRSLADERTGRNPVFRNPAFVAGDASDFHLTAQSAAIDTGSDEGAPAEDFDGNTRPQGKGCDIGAFEHMP